MVYVYVDCHHYNCYFQCLLIEGTGLTDGDSMNDILAITYMGSVLRISVLIFFGIPLVRWLSNIFVRFGVKRFSQHIGFLIGNIIFYSGILCIAIAVLYELGFNVAALLGAAGLFGVAIGFASQTSVSNIISGFFLVLER